MAKGNMSGGKNYSNRVLSNERMGDSDFYDTFDSGDGPTVPDGMEDDFAHQDGKGLGGYTMNEISGLDLEVPEVPSKKR